MSSPAATSALVRKFSAVVWEVNDSSSSALFDVFTTVVVLRVGEMNWQIPASRLKNAGSEFPQLKATRWGLFVTRSNDFSVFWPTQSMKATWYCACGRNEQCNSVMWILPNRVRFNMAIFHTARPKRRYVKHERCLFLRNTRVWSHIFCSCFCPAKPLPSASTPDPASKDYEKLGCAADLTDNVRVRYNDKEPGMGNRTAATRAWRSHDTARKPTNGLPCHVERDGSR